MAVAAGGPAAPEAVEALEKLLGPGALPPELKPEVITADLPGRIAQVKKSVPPLRRAQVLRDLCVIARADGHVSDAELAVIQQIAAGVEVDLSLVTCAFDRTSSECAAQPPA